MQPETAWWNICHHRTAIEGIAQQRMSYTGEMQPDLMAASGTRKCFDQRKTRHPPKWPDRSGGRAASRRGGCVRQNRDHLTAIFRMMRDRSDYLDVIFYLSDAYRQVA